MRALVAIVVCLGLIFSLNLAHGDEGPEPGLNPNVVSLLGPIKNLLSGRVGLIVEGLDPLMLNDPKKAGRQDGIGSSPFSGVGLQAPGPAGLVPFRSPAPAFSRGILVTRDLGTIPFQTEPSLAVDPNDPDHLILGVIDYNFPSLVNYVSQDGGASWEGPFPVPYPAEDLASAGDPVVVIDRKGTAHYASISLDVEEFSIGPTLLVALVSGIAVSSSEDGGFTWSRTTPTARSTLVSRDLAQDQLGRIRGTILLSFLDKPWMTVGPHHLDEDRDVIYVTYTDFTQEFEIGWIGELPFLTDPALITSIQMVKSEDSGRTWSEPIAVSPLVRRISGEVDQPADAPGQAAGTKRVVQGSQPLVAADGTLYVAWFDSTDDDTMEGLGEIYVARSEDGGKTFLPPIRASVFNEIGFRPRTASFRNWASSFPQIGLGSDGELYMVYSSRPSGKPRDDADVYFVRSLDEGETWSDPLRLNGDETSSLQFFPSLAVDPKGNLHAMWGDTRDDPSGLRYHIYYTTSEDGGETWGFELEDLGLKERDARVSDFASNPNHAFPGGRFLGDYFSIQATEEDVYMVWADARLGEFGGVNQKIAFARRRPVPSPEVFLNPPAGPGGQEVTLQGFGFQPDMNIFIRVGGVLVSTDRTNQEGRFTAPVFIPISGEGGHAVDVFDDSGNVATSSFFMEFGFDSIQDQQKELIKHLEALTGIPLPASDDPTPNNSTGTTSNPGSGALGDSGSTPWGIWAWAIGASAVALVAAAAVLVIWRRNTYGYRRWYT